MRKLPLFVICILISLSAWSRGGGGCFEEGTLINTPIGKVKIENLKVDDAVYSRDKGKQQKAKVVATTKVTPDHYIEIKLSSSILHVTDEHLIATAIGVYRRAGSLKKNDKIMVWQNNHWQSVSILAINRITAKKPAYNLLVDNGSSYVANQALVHNKGCFLPETPVLLANGTSIAISQIKPGDMVEAYEPNGKLMTTEVRAVLQHQVNTYFIVATEKIELNVTGEHPFYVGDGIFKTVESLHIGDVIYAYAGKQLVEQHIISMKEAHADATVYNLQTDEPHTYFAAGIAVHNKGGGCFPAGTKIKTPDGFKSIELLAPGDAVISINRNGSRFVSKVKSTYATHSNILTLITNQGSLRTTAEHPLATGAGHFKRADEFSVSDTISFFINGVLTNAVIQAVQHAPEEMVFNLETNSPHTFIADNVLVHNKGGGGGGGGGHGSSRSCAKGDVFCNIIEPVIFVIFFAGIVVFNFMKRNSEDLDYLNSKSNIRRKSVKTITLLNFLAKQDAAMLPQALEERAREVFLKLQQCWMKRDYAPMKELLMPDLYRQHLKQIEGMIRNHEINRLDDLSIMSIDLVNVRYTEKEYQREFTALISAKAADYYMDDKSYTILRGNTFTQPFQEFWTFELEPDGWRLRDIEQARESDYLKEENFVEMFTDLQIQKIYGGEIDNLGASGPWLPKAVAQKENKVDRMLNFLYQNNKMWERQAMVTRVRSVFTQVHMALEAGKLDTDTENALFPDVAVEFKETLNTWHNAGNTIEYRNFCIRKIEIVLVKSFNDKTKNTFTARVSAHAQIIHLRKGAVISKDTDVTRFIELWEFGCLNNEWKLKDASPQSDTDIISEENIEEGSSPNLVKWYYTKKRAI